MTDKKQIRINKALQAKALLENELLQEAFVTLDEAYIAAWRICPTKDTEGRERLWQAVNIIGKVREHLIRAVTSGRLAEAEIKADLLGSQR